MNPNSNPCQEQIPETERGRETNSLYSGRLPRSCPNLRSLRLSEVLSLWRRSLPRVRADTVYSWGSRHHDPSHPEVRPGNLCPGQDRSLHRRSVDGWGREEGSERNGEMRRRDRGTRGRRKRYKEMQERVEWQRRKRERTAKVKSERRKRNEKIEKTEGNDEEKNQWNHSHTEGWMTKTVLGKRGVPKEKSKKSQSKTTWMERMESDISFVCLDGKKNKWRQNMEAHKRRIKKRTESHQEDNASDRRCEEIPNQLLCDPGVQPQTDDIPLWEEESNRKSSKGKQKKTMNRTEKEELWLNRWGKWRRTKTSKHWKDGIIKWMTIIMSLMHRKLHIKISLFFLLFLSGWLQT